MTQVVLTNHAKARLLEREIGVHDAKKIAKNGKIVQHGENGTLKRRGLSYDKRNIIVVSKEEKGKLLYSLHIMKIEYDKKADAKYIRLKDGKVAKTIEKKPWLFFDCDRNGEVIGMEILNASKHPVNFSIKDRNTVGYTMPLEMIGV